MKNKICRVCGLIGSEELFAKKENICKICKKEYNRIQSRINRSKNRDKLRLKHKLWRDKNPDKIKINGKREYNKNIHRKLYNGAKDRAIKNNLEFNLTIEYIKTLECKKCPYFNIDLYTDKNHIHSRTLDRIDPSKGYTIDNVEMISKKANIIKNNSTIEEQELIIKYMYNSPIISNSIEDVLKIYSLKKLKRAYSRKRAMAKFYNVEFNISFDYFISLFPLNKTCPVLSIKFDEFGKKCAPNLISLGRINPDKGYIINNICIISHRANTLKSNATIEELQMMVNRRKEIQK